MLSLYSILLLILTIGHCLTSEPGLRMRLTKKGLDYANTVAQDAIAKALPTLKIPDIKGSSGILSYRLVNIINKGDNPPTSSMIFNSGLDGLTWTLDNFGINLYGDWSATADMGLFSISDSGSVDIDLSQVTVSVTVGLGVDQANRPLLKALNCDSNIGGVSLDFHGGSAWFWNLLSGILEGVIADSINLCDMVDDLINKDAEAQVAQMKVTIEIAERFLLDYGLLAPVTFTSDYMESLQRGEVYWKDDKRESPFTPAPIPAWGDYTNMLYLWLTEYTAVTFAYVAQRYGYLMYNLTQNDLPDDSKSLLNTTCKIKCIGALIPQIGQKYPNAVVEIQINSTAVPMATITNQGLGLSLSGDLRMVARLPGDQLAYLLTLNMSLSLTGDASIANDKVAGKINNNSFVIAVVDSAVGEVNEKVLNFIFGIALNTSVIPTFNKMAQKGFELPLTENIKLQNSKLVFLDGVIVLASDVEYVNEQNSSPTLKVKTKF